MFEPGLDINESVHPEGDAVRHDRMPDYTQLPLEAFVAIAKIFEEGESVYGRNNWRKGGEKYRKDAANHAFAHMLKYYGTQYNGVPPTYEDDLAKVGWWVCTELWHREQEQGSLQKSHDLDIMSRNPWDPQNKKEGV